MRSAGATSPSYILSASELLTLSVSPAMNPQKYYKHFIPLESNPVVFTELIHRLGTTPSLCFQDVLSLDDIDLLGFISRPVHAMVLVFPTTKAYERRVEVEDGEVRDVLDGDNVEDVVFFRQTINNACGLYAVLHAVCNGAARTSIEPESLIDRLLEKCLPLPPRERALALGDDEELERVYAEVALEGDTEAPSNAEDEVDFHYIAFVRSHINGHLYQLDGDRKRPLKLALLEDREDLLSEKCLTVIRSMMSADGDSLNFSLMALVGQT
ncbi:ubiquitin carboxyl-terminal hydrolase [Boeremia exigua]|uniref:ubiquitin carboxyl-terminal hydrolase n=1 Tax=Boeremia exigua TaxID=749465 RepID=UPI001E8CB6F7|nr:ubiquitin carboxyl-terminal hydrolase [Boeremia exigua]KAH6639560.1 ubiquitin carboxyl-terminal hydrolase [Boeremia exigua]